ncbi:MAG: hypothetical protein H6813_01145 [Phycisphaeraceae bacterium]|nr:hypothetical protein [Phycisphaeraceae bacterium]MCB9847308.1 hypothetical protein [Phycisphaeraceae bacterium]
MSENPDANNPIPPELLGRAPAPAPEPDRYSMDPAQQSLADALRITYRLLQVVMLLLVALFLGSGFQTIGASERGVKLAFGRISSSDVTPGSVWNWPYPVGEVVRVSTAQQVVNVWESFFPRLTPDLEKRPREQLANLKPTLKPGTDGSLITADGNIAHTRWEVAYRIDRVTEYIDNIYQPDEKRIVRAAVERGVVRAVAELEIDGLLKQVASVEEGGAGSTGALSTRVRSIAQETLDAARSGIQIEEVILTDKMAPLPVYKTFSEVTAASSRAAQQREKAAEFRLHTLNQAAGLANGVLLSAINEYERASELGEPDRAEQILARIHTIIDGETVTDESGREVSVSGDVTSIINEAKQYRSTVIAEARSAATTFQAKLASYRENPEVFLANERRMAWEAFLANSLAEIAILPPGTGLSILLNRDPDIIKELERERGARQADQTLQERVQLQQDAMEAKKMEDNGN